jgi:hypothetical protein
MKGFHCYFVHNGSINVKKDVDSSWPVSSCVIGINSRGQKIVPKIEDGNTWYGRHERVTGYGELYDFICGLEEGWHKIVRNGKLDRLLRREI